MLFILVFYRQRIEEKRKFVKVLQSVLSIISWKNHQKVILFSFVARQNFLEGPNLAEQAAKTHAAFARAPLAQTKFMREGSLRENSWTIFEILISEN